jgi:transcriptional regulator with XRE-family HTH domain
MTSVDTSTPRRRGVRSRAQDIDRHVGARMRERRIMLGLTQQEMADLIGVTYQQAHKYERGINRISAGRLFAVAQILGVDVGYFFEGLGGAETGEPTAQQRMLLDLARAFIGLPSRRHQEALCALARALAETAESNGEAARAVDGRVPAHA